jgi:hypothetical protein
VRVGQHDDVHGRRSQAEKRQYGNDHQHESREPFQLAQELQDAMRMSTVVVDASHPLSLFAIKKAYYQNLAL